MTTSAIDTAYWKRIDALFEVALALPRTERQRWLDSLDSVTAQHKQVLADMLGRVPGLRCLTLVAGLADPEMPDLPAEEADDPS